MRAVVARAFGPPESLSVEVLPLPQPGRGQVRIAIRAAGVSFVDALIASGGYQLKPPLPFVPGSEFAGVVDAVGEGVETLQAGARVAVSAFGGALAEAAVVPVGACVPIPARMSFETASIFRVSYATAYHGLVDRGRLQAGETVLVLGAGGAIGAACVQVAKALGAHVIASASSEDKRDLAREMGADEAVDSRAGDWREQIKALTGGQGVDVVVDPVGGEASEAAVRALAWEGRHLVMGFVGGIAKIPANLPLLKGAAIVGVDVRQFGERQPERAARNVEALFDLYAKGALEPRVAQRFPLDRFAEALTAAKEGAAAGRIVIAPT